MAPLFGPLFDRHEELKALKGHVSCGAGMIMVLGPMSSGKSCFLKHLKTMWKPSYLFDLRLSIQIQGLELDVVEEEADNLAAVLRALVAASKGLRPVFIIDQADELKQWPPLKADALLDCLAEITAAQQATIVMSAYNDSLREDWLGSRVVIDHIIYLGHFSEAMAKSYFCMLLTTTWSRWLISWVFSPLTPQKWEKIYGVCGGCPLLLNECAASAFTSQNPTDLDTVLGGIASEMSSRVYSGLAGGDGWEGNKFRDVMEVISEGGGAAEWEVVCDKVFNKDEAACISQLNAMRAGGVVHIQFVPSSKHKLVMPMSPAQCQAARNVIAQLTSGD